jgi:hypothetical protein
MTIYNVTIKPTENENRFHITWHDVEENTVDSFEQTADITPEETQKLWQKPEYQSAIGEKLFRFLDGDARHFLRALNQAHLEGETLQVHLLPCLQTADWPFELLSYDGSFLLPHKLHLVRYVSDWGTERIIPPANRPLKLLFMACSAMNVKPELDYEREEDAIYHITEKLAIDMEVEDSGSLEGLRGELEQEQYDVVLLSGHADIDKEKGPFFIMEDETGHMEKIFPDKLWGDALIENPPRLLFLSGCRTGETAGKNDKPGTPESTAAVSFARLLVEKYNIPAVLGWGRSVGDTQAAHAAKIFLHELSRGKAILDAVKRTRYELLKGFTLNPNQAWPLLRLFSSGVALNPIVQKGQRPLPKPRRMTHVYLENSRVQVLAEGFVGRRRQLQAALHALEQDFYKVGVLLLGTAGLGKSCLAGKICERFNDFTLVTVNGKLNAVTLEAALRDAFIIAQDEKGQQILSQKIETTKKLANLCATSFKEKNYLLLLDGFDLNLEGADNGFPGPLLPEASDLLKALLHYLQFSGKMTHLVIAGRYDFSLTQQGRNLVDERLKKIWLTGFQESEQRKKARELNHIFIHHDKMSMARVIQASHGNPRLMEWMDSLVGQMPSAEEPELMEAVKKKQDRFIKEHSIRELFQRGGDPLAHFLSCLSIYRRPVLKEGFKLTAEKAGLENWEDLLQKAMGFGLIEYDETHQSYRVTPLLRDELLENIKDKQACDEAAFEYYQNACDIPGQPDPNLVEELVFHSSRCGKEEELSRHGAWLVEHYRKCLDIPGSRRVEEWVSEELRSLKERKEK